jgi:HK97 family phage major capsid protein
MNPALTGSPHDFINVVRAMLLSRTNSDAVQQAEHQRFDRATRILKAVVAGGSLADPSWAGSLVDYTTAVNAFVDSLRTAGAFDAIFPAMTRIPMGTRAAFTVIGATGAVVNELQYKPLSRLSLDAADLVPRKAICIFAVTNELARAVTSNGANEFLVRELKGAVAAAIDLAFLPELAVGATQIASTGSTAVEIYQDLKRLSAAVPTGAASRLHLVMSAPTAAQIAMTPTQDGAPAFPLMTPAGGEIQGTPVIVSDALAGESAGSTSILLVDASGIVADVGTITLDRSNVATLQLNDAPVGTASAAPQSLWQSDLTGLKAERYFAFSRLRDDAVAELTNVDYGAP